MSDSFKTSTDPEATQTPRHEFWNRLVNTDRNQWRGLLSRERVLDGLKSLLWVVPLTLLIWIYAEREQRAEEPEVSIPINVTTSDPNRIVRLSRPFDENVVADLSGPRARLDRVRERLVPTPETPALTIDIDHLGLAPGRDHTVPASTVLANHPTFVREGITVSNIRPNTFEIYVDEIVERSVPITTPPDIDNLEGEPIFDPPTAIIRGPRTFLDEVEQQNELVVYARLADLDVLRTPGSYDAEVSLTRPPALQQQDVTIVTSRVDASFEVRQADIAYEIPSMPIFVRGPPALLTRFEVVHDPPILSNVTVVGPPDLIQRLRDGELSPAPTATITVSRDDLGQQRSRAVRYDLPEGIRISERDAQREVRFELVDQNATVP